jgi:hypothetical protein
MKSRETKKMTTLRALTLLVVAMALTGLGASSASASPLIEDFTVGSSDTEAGAHPDLTTSIVIEEPGEPEVVQDVAIDLPTGVFGNPGAISKCRSSDFAINACTPASQAGLVTIRANYENDPEFLLGTVPVYNMETVSEDEAARISFVAPIVNIPITVPISVRSDSDYGLRLGVTGISQQVPLRSADFTIWGFPADPEHDRQRFKIGSPGNPPACVESLTTDCLGSPHPEAGLLLRPYTNNPSICTGQELPVDVSVVSYQDPDTPATADSSYPATTGCENQKFDPVFNLGLTTNEADSPSGLDIQLKADQFLDGTASSPATLRTATLTLPEGLTINPDAADGQTACTDSEAGFNTDQPGACPDSSKIGTVEVNTPALDGPLLGSLYIGEPRPGDQYRVFMVFDGFGIHAKLVADFQPNPQTGQLTMSLEDIPQVPFEEFNLHLFASDRGLMATPTHCTIYGSTSKLTPWNNLVAAQSSSPNISISSGPHGSECPAQVRPFHPRLVAGTSNSVAGNFSAFTLKLDRDDGDQFLRDLNFKLPPGFTGSLRGLSYCSEQGIAAAARNSGLAEQAVGSCPASSEVGTSNVAAGPGGHPFHALGKMYLAGPFKGAPLSIVAVTPALAGPYDYGVVVVRVALKVDPQTAQVTAASDTVPSIIGGIPIRMRSIQVNIDKPNFTINPTNCAPFSVDSQGIGDQGTVTDFSSYFQVVNCTRLGFQPTMKVALAGKKTKRSQNPALKFDLRTRPGDANIKSLAVTLSKAFEIDQSHLGNICSEKELVEKDCAGRTAIGKATTTTPLLDQPLSGPVYAVSGSGGLPRLAFILDGQVKLLPRADTKTVKGKLKTTVPVVPDAPIGHFSLTIFGGKTGYLSNTRDICKNQPAIKVDFTGQNGKTRTQNVKVKTGCSKKGKK